MAPFGDAVGLVARSELRRRWRALLGLALLVGLIGTVSLAGFAGARRTASALDRFEDATLARDAIVLGRNGAVTQQWAAELQQEPWVEVAAEYLDFFVAGPETSTISVYAGVDGSFARDVDRPLILDGRMPSGDVPDEVAIDEVARDTYDVGVGDEIPVTTFTPESLRCLLSGSCPFLPEAGPPIDLQVVGIVRDVDAFRTTDDPTPSVTASSAFTDEYRGVIGALRSEIAVRFDDDDGPAQLEAFMDDRRGNGTTIAAAEEYAAGAGDAINVLGTALLVFGLVTAAAGTFATFQAVARQVDEAARSTPFLPALGMTRFGWAWACALPSVLAGTLGALLAPVIAAAASGEFPIGFADRVEPNPGFRPDLPVLVGGAALIVLLVGGWAVLTGRRRSTPRPGDGGWVPALRWARLVPAAGGRLAFGRGRGRAAGPMRSAMLGITVGTVGALAAWFVLVSANDLEDEPARWGVPWDATGTSLAPEGFDDLAQTIADDERIEAVSILGQVIVQAPSLELSTFAFEGVEGDIQPTVRRGRLPTADDEIALGEATMDALDVDIGDSFTVDGATDRDPETDEVDVDLRVVGSVVLPTFGQVRPADGAVMTPEGLLSVQRGDQTHDLLLNYVPGSDPADVGRHLLTTYAVGTLEPILPAQLAHLGEATVVIRALVAFFLGLALVGLVQALALAGPRQRGTVAIWRGLGFVPWQARGAVLWQAVLITAAGVVVGVPLGLYVGSVAWRLTIERVGVVDDPSWPVLPSALALPIAVAAAVLLAAVPAWLAARGEPAQDLHAE